MIGITSDVCSWSPPKVKSELCQYKKKRFAPFQVIEVVSPSIRELQGTPKEPHDEFQPSPNSPQRKRNPISSFGLFKLLTSSGGSVCVLTIWYFQPFGNAGLQSPRDLPIAAHSRYPPQSTLRENPPLLKFMTNEQIFSLI